MYSKQRWLICDESGNLGSSGRYFVIACIDTQNEKELHNIMKRKLKIAKNKFPKLGKLHENEIKAKDAYPCVKHHILECIISKDISISYIVIDLHYIEQRLLKDKNILYNYATKILMQKLVTVKDSGSRINIIFDNKTSKITSKDSLKDYIISTLLYERDLDIEINFEYRDSNAKNAYIIQATDYVANALYGKYEYNDNLYADIFNNKINIREHFPYKKFGK